MRILLSYSKVHFDPDSSSLRQKFRGLSASFLAESLYCILSRFGRVTYIDSNDYLDVKGKHFDLFVGIANNFDRILRICSIKTSIFWAVNRHPRDRNALLIKYFLKEKLSFLSFSGWDFHNIWRIGYSLKKANYIICIGNSSTFNSYVKYGISKNKIKCINYATGPTKQMSKPQKGKSIEYLYLASEIGLRKGFDVLSELFTSKDIKKKDFHLNIVGSPTNGHYKKLLDSFLIAMGSKAKYYGWVPADSKEYSEIISKSDFLVFPSVEEGQVGTVVDCIRSGVIPILSKNSGVDWSPLGFLNTSRNSIDNSKILEKSWSLDEKTLLDLKIKTQTYYREFHGNFNRKLFDIIEACLQNKLYPKISIILPIFNKEKTIYSLINLLDKACRCYGNCELHLFFDGCRDLSETVVRRFYRKRMFYPVTYKKTRNIFETKTNNLGLKKSKGKYCIIIQDDNYILDSNSFIEAVNFMEKNDNVAILGGLAGVNYFPLGFKVPGKKGQIVESQDEVYWRQDARTDSTLAERFFEVDAVMRGPLIIRKSFLEKYGYLDEIYSPLYQDDMDICFRARKYGYRVFCFLSKALNTSLTIAHYNEKDNRRWNKIIKRNTYIFYRRWKPEIKKDYLQLYREPVCHSYNEKFEILIAKIYLNIEKFRGLFPLRISKIKRIFFSL